ncbi:hypothetical protein [uncultured Cellulomonas sp.]|uniref:hypothetical protein n=1 Tax=uncultured Cellulomonas sp. TaxID=189682 RepID=UPI0028F13436|nr:hypothetical protein [uncultured Cellulomonas sp.]
MQRPLTPLVSLAVVLLAAGGLTACTSPSPEPSASPTGSTPASSSPTPTPTPTVDDEAAVQAAFDRYWAAVVEVQRGNPDPALFTGVAEGGLVEGALAVGRDFQANGIVREGQPTFSGQQLTVTGDTATVWVCTDNSTWTVPGQTVAPGVSLVQPNGLAFERRDASWVVVDAFVPPAEFTC